MFVGPALGRKTYFSQVLFPGNFTAAQAVAQPGVDLDQGAARR